MKGYNIDNESREEKNGIKDIKVISKKKPEEEKAKNYK